MNLKTALITGAAGGIGKACAEAFIIAGYQVAVSDIDHQAAQDLASALGANAKGFALDVTRRDCVIACYQEVLNHFGGIDVLHANAGVSNMKPAIELSDEDWDFNFNVNAKGVFLTNQEIVKVFLTQQNSGCIINTASLAAKVGAPLLAHYSASKFAVLGWTQALAREHAKDGIRVNAVCPGFVKTAMQEREVIWEAELLGKTPAQVTQSYIDQTPLGRLEVPEDVADVVVFLASEKARFMTGQAINVTGGVYMG